MNPFKLRPEIRRVLESLDRFPDVQWGFNPVSNGTILTTADGTRVVWDGPYFLGLARLYRPKTVIFNIREHYEIRKRFKKYREAAGI